MCPWCFLTPACPCRHGGGPPSATLGKALVAVARRLWRVGSRLAQSRRDVSISGQIRPHHAGGPFRPEFPT
jgi:hypothetical protein